MKNDNSYNFTILILTPLKLEQDAILAHMPNAMEYCEEGEFYFKASYNTAFYNLRIISQESGVTNITAALATERAIKRFSPQVVILAGIAGGAKDVKIGDVLTVTKNYGYESGKDTPLGRAVRPEIFNNTPQLVRLAKSLSKKKPIVNHNFLFGAIASGDTLISTKEIGIYPFLKDNFNDTIAVDMEGIGVGKTLEEYSHIHSLHVRGISDLLDDKTKTDKNGYQNIAAINAANFVFKIINNLNLQSINLPMMDIKTIATTTAALLGPLLKKSKSVKNITEEIGSAADNTLKGIWDTVKGIFVEEFEEEGVLNEYAKKTEVVEFTLSKKLEKEKELKIQLEKLLSKHENSKYQGNLNKFVKSIKADNSTVGGSIISGNNNRVNSPETTTNNNNIAGDFNVYE